MYIEFDKLEETSKVWIYQSERNFSEDEVKEVDGLMRSFIDSWQAHSKDLEASYEIRYNRFLVVGLQEGEKMCGHALDELAYFIEALGKRYEMDLLDRMNVSYREGNAIMYKNLLDFRKMVQHKELGADTVVFNNLVTNVYEYKNNWEVPMEFSWHNRYLKK